MPRLLAGGVALLAFAPPAGAAELQVSEGGHLQYIAAPGERNALTIRRDGDEVVFREAAARITTRAVQTCVILDAGAGARCRQPQRAAAVGAQLGDGDDTAESVGEVGDPFLGGLDFDGGTGNDTLTVGGRDRATLFGGLGRDTLRGGPGYTSINALDVTGAGRDEIRNLRPEADVLSCGSGGGTAAVDPADPAPAGCKQTTRYSRRGAVTRGTEAGEFLGGAGVRDWIYGLGGDDSVWSNSKGGYADAGPGNDHLEGGPYSQTLKGGPGNDLIVGDSHDDPYGGGRTGDDRIIAGPGNDVVEAYGGADRVDGGPGVDRLLGMDGPDLIRARDGERDTVSCGAGRDRVVADRRDDVARDCERVVRR